MGWVELKYSKKLIRRSGDYLIDDHGDQLDLDRYFDAYIALDNWRASHAYPMRSMIGYFRNKAFEVDKNAIVAQRLKRLPSILAKLLRENGMKLDRVEDIGGCRVVVKNINNVYEVRDSIVGGRTRNILRRERNYIKTPKESGYRGIHLIYKYNGAKQAFLGHFIELQIRSQVQHSWATAVEVVGTFTGQALKASQGKEEWINFFKLSSIAFTDMEKKSLKKNAKTKEREELIEYINKLNVFEKLTAFRITTQHLGKDNKNKGDYFLLILDTKESNISFERYSREDLSKASSRYSELEQTYKDDISKDVVLVAATSIHNLKKAYPNYFADTGEFAKYLDKVVEANK